MRRSFATVVLLAAALVTPGPAWGHDAQRHHHGGLVVRTDSGAVRGLHADGVDKFLGIPYAAPPVGALRWQPPAPAQRWGGVRPATAYGARCPQLPSSNGAGSENEDCLTLNVFGPGGRSGGHAARWARGGRRLPVLLWIHGGGLINGSGDQHDGALLARTNRIVVVSINYRLGVFGFLALPGMGAGAGDFGLLDQQAALRWVSQNIGAFGGDSRRITIAGESAGGWSTCANLVSPAVRGLFAGAIVQSGSCFSRTPAESQSAGTQFAQGLGCSDADCLRTKSVAELLAPAFQPAITSGGSELPEAPADAVAAGHFPRVPVVYGANRDEGRTFAQDFGPVDVTREQYEAFVTDQFGADAPAVLAQYPYDAFPSPYTSAYAVGAIWTDSGAIAGIGGCATRDTAGTLAQNTRTYMYEFADRNAPALNNHHPGYMWGAGHAMELAYMWPSFDNGIPLAAQFTPAQQQLSDEMVRYWGAFTRFGAPFVRGQAFWPPYAHGQRVLSLRPGGQTTPISDADYAAEHKCAFWEALGG
jgi:carboxylesterase type B